MRGRRSRTREHPVLDSLSTEVEWIARSVLDNAPAKECLTILEAGCGREWALDLGGRPHTLTGVDLSEQALEHRRSVVRDLDIAIVGDLATVDLGYRAFDVIYSAYVLEHVVGVRRVLENFDRWLRPGGLVVLRLPDRDSFLGLLARLTPHRTHVWYYRYLLRRPQAGEDGRAPFAVVYESIISVPALRQFFTERDYEEIGVRFTRPFPGRDQVFWRVLRMCVVTVGAMTFGMVAHRHNNVGIIFRKQVKPAST